MISCQMCVTWQLVYLTVFSIRELAARSWMTLMMKNLLKCIYIDKELIIDQAPISKFVEHMHSPAPCQRCIGSSLLS
jgi:hypothetical protein